MALNVYQREPDEYQGYAPNPDGFPYVFLLEILWPDKNIWPIREWLLERYGQEGAYWCYHYDSIWFRKPEHAIEFKLRWV